MDAWMLSMILIPGRAATLIILLEILTLSDTTVFVWVWELKKSLDWKWLMTLDLRGQPLYIVLEISKIATQGTGMEWYVNQYEKS